METRTSAHASAQASTPVWRLLAVTVGVGIGAGLGGMLLALLLHLIQHLAFGYSPGAIVSQESFLQGVSAAGPLRRVLVLALCGALAGFGWWAVYHFGKPLVSIAKAVKSDDPRMPLGSTTAHALLQIITVALGSPLGREVAPREIGALFAGWLAHRAGLNVRESRIMLACGAGAGLAAVYNVPLGGALFVLEVLLASFSWTAAMPALLSATIATVVAWWGLGNQPQYVVPHYALSAALLSWAAVAGPLFGLAAYGFAKLTSAARARAPRDWQLPLLSIINFSAIGLLSIQFPELLGNGKGPAQVGFDSNLSIGLAGMLLVLKVIITGGVLRGGAEGGLLTPGLSNGALLAIVLGGCWNMLWPGTPLGAFAIIGAAAFLASSMRMPLTAAVLLFEFTGVEHDFLLPMLLAIAGSVGTLKLCEQVPWRVRLSQLAAACAVARRPSAEQPLAPPP
jgi:H+/Cl- antiporter ClcA